MDPSLLDDIINRLLEVRGKPGKQVQLSESEIKQLCVVSRDIFLQQPNLLELEAPIKICGILHQTHLVLAVFLSFEFCVLCFGLIALIICTWFCFFVEFMLFLGTELMAFS
ncbi:hypothetical protein CsSME_00000174 [Camellia sinensis var. sinensis]